MWVIKKAKEFMKDYWQPRIVFFFLIKCGKGHTFLYLFFQSHGSLKYKKEEKKEEVKKKKRVC